MYSSLFLLVSVMASSAATFAADSGQTLRPTKPWNRHTIDNSSRGADGVRLADANGDGLLDITTAWEEGGVVRVYLNPGPKKSKQKWPAVTVGKVKSGEDAVFVDLDNDGAMDVVSSCEGKTRTMYVHWAPKDKTKYLDAKAWKTEAIPATAKQQLWMFCLPMDVDGKHGIDLVVGSKGGGATVGWLESPHPPNSPRDLIMWKFHAKYKAGWIMSLIAADMDDDGDLDIVLSDRKGGSRGIHWLEIPDPPKAERVPTWKNHPIGGTGKEVMFISTFRFRGHWTVQAAIKPNHANYYLGKKDDWEELAGTFPTDRFGTAKAMVTGNLLHNGKRQWVVSCENANGKKSGLFMYEMNPTKKFYDIAGPKGVKFDRIELIDLDNDGDLDILTCEERDNLGVIWYENPTKSR